MIVELFPLIEVAGHRIPFGKKLHQSWAHRSRQERARNWTWEAGRGHTVVVLGWGSNSHAAMGAHYPLTD